MPIVVTTGALLEFKLKGFFDNAQEVNNVFHYVVTAAGGATLDQFAAGLWSDLSSVLLPRTNAIVNYDLIDARLLNTDAQLVNGETYLIPSGTGVGADGGDALPPFVCWTFKYLRPNASFRHGYKRFAGVSEAAQAKGLPTSGVIASLATIADMLGDVLQAHDIAGDGTPGTAISGATMKPVIVQKVLNGDELSPVNLGDTAGVVFSRVGSQNTRKYGRGS